MTFCRFNGLNDTFEGISRSFRWYCLVPLKVLFSRFNGTVSSLQRCCLIAAKEGRLSKRKKQVMSYKKTANLVPKKEQDWQHIG